MHPTALARSSHRRSRIWDDQAAFSPMQTHRLWSPPVRRPGNLWIARYCFPQTHPSHFGRWRGLPSCMVAGVAMDSRSRPIAEVRLPSAEGAAGSSLHLSTYVPFIPDGTDMSGRFSQHATSVAAPNAGRWHAPGPRIACRPRKPGLTAFVSTPTSKSRSSRSHQPFRAALL